MLRKTVKLHAQPTSFDHQLARGLSPSNCGNFQSGTLISACSVNKQRAGWGDRDSAHDDRQRHIMTLGETQ